MSEEKTQSADTALGSEHAPSLPIERVQLGVRMEKRLVKVLKGIAEYHDRTLGELLEDIVLHSFEGGGANAFGPQSLKVIADLKRVYGLEYDTHANYRFTEKAKAGE